MTIEQLNNLKIGDKVKRTGTYGTGPKIGSIGIVILIKSPAGAIINFGKDYKEYGCSCENMELNKVQLEFDF
jgi:hypothetical protein